MWKTIIRNELKIMYLTITFSVMFIALFISIAYAGTVNQVYDFGRNPGDLKMYQYVPEDMPANAPLVVSLHGCTQSAATYSKNGWTNLADKLKFYVLFPEQYFLNNYISCFNWFELSDIKRGVGEAQSIISMVENMKSDYSIDEKRIFIEGLSAGGYMTANMLAAYPDVFSGGAINAGGPAYCATSKSYTDSCMNGTDKSPKQWGDLVRSMGYRGYSGPWPKISIWHGDRDPTVDIKNQIELMEQWTNVHNIDQVPDKSDRVRNYPHKEYHNDKGKVLVETYTIERMGHATPVDPGFVEANGCGSAGAFIEDKDICAVYYIAEFFNLLEGEPEIIGGDLKINNCYKIKGNIPDENLDRVEISNEAVKPDNRGDWEYEKCNLQNGEHTWKVKAVDKTGSSMGEQKITFTIGKTIPVTPTESVCKEWEASNSTHEREKRAYSEWFFAYPFGISYNYYAIGSKEPLGKGSETTIIRKEDPNQEHYKQGKCP